jgi:hypothetical protein
MVVSLAAAAGGMFGGAIASFASSDPMPGIGALAGSSAFVSVVRLLGRTGVAP